MNVETTAAADLTRAEAPELADPTSPPNEHHGLGRDATVLGGLVVALIVACIAAASIGAFDIAPTQVVAAIGRKIGLLGDAPLHALNDQVLWEIRFPRVVLGAIVGGSLGAAGAAMQGSFANPLAEPGIVGVSSGAVLGAVAQIVLGFAPLGTFTLPFAAFIGGVITVAVVYFSSRANGRTEVVTLILTGVALNALLGAIIGLFTYFSEDAELRSITFWTLGSVANATWTKVVAVAPFALIGLVVAIMNAHKLDLLALGERPARHLGLRVEQFRIVMLAVTAILTASAVAVSGIILFIGLVVPHLVRVMAGPRHRVLLPASALLGAALLVIADLVARTIAAPSEIPLGVLTSILGSPVFLWQLRRTRASQGGWA